MPNVESIATAHTNTQEFIVVTNHRLFEQMTPSLPEKVSSSTLLGGPRRNASPHQGLGRRDGAFNGRLRGRKPGHSPVLGAAASFRRLTNQSIRRI